MATNPHHTEYAPPVLRAPSPASSIGTTYGEDQTSVSDSEEVLSQPAFEKKWEERMALGVARPEELQANEEPLLPRHPGGSFDEKQLFEQVLTRLTEAVHDLEENELFERTLLRGSQAALEPIPTTTDIDALMRSMMVSPQTSSNISQEADHPRGRLDIRNGDTTSGPWIPNGRERSDKPPILKTGLTPGKRSRNGSRRN